MPSLPFNAIDIFLYPNFSRFVLVIKFVISSSSMINILDSVRNPY